MTRPPTVGTTPACGSERNASGASRSRRARARSPTSADSDSVGGGSPNEERRPARPAQQSTGRSKEHPVCLVQPRTRDLAAKNRQLVAQYHDLELLELTRAQPQCRDRQYTAKQKVQQRYDQAAASLHPNPKKPTLRSRTQLRRTTWGARRNYVPQPSDGDCVVAFPSKHDRATVALWRRCDASGAFISPSTVPRAR
jgi:hypothetical protein